MFASIINYAYLYAVSVKQASHLFCRVVSMCCPFKLLLFHALKTHSALTCAVYLCICESAFTNIILQFCVATTVFNLSSFCLNLKVLLCYSQYLSLQHPDRSAQLDWCTGQLRGMHQHLLKYDFHIIHLYYHDSINMQKSIFIYLLLVCVLRLFFPSLGSARFQKSSTVGSAGIRVEKQCSPRTFRCGGILPSHNCSTPSHQHHQMHSSAGLSVCGCPTRCGPTG